MIRLLLAGDDDLARGLRQMLVVGLALGVGGPLVQSVLAGTRVLGPALNAVLPILYFVTGPLVSAALIGLVLRAVGLSLMGRSPLAGATVPAPTPAPPGDAAWRPPPTR